MTDQTNKDLPEFSLDRHDLFDLSIELLGVIEDVKNGMPFDDVCMETIISVRERLVCLDALSASAPAAGSVPSTPEQVISFIGCNFNSMEADGWTEDLPQEPTGDLSNVRYSLSVHDLLSAFSEWSDSALLAQYGSPAWRPIETAPMPKIGHTGYGERTLLAVDCGPGTLPSVKIGWWSGHEWASDTGFASLPSLGYRVTHWMPLPPAPQEGQ